MEQPFLKREEVRQEEEQAEMKRWGGLLKKTVTKATTKKERTKSKRNTPKNGGRSLACFG